jgi:excinuclease UvrABC ATPase subunit
VQGGHLLASGTPEELAKNPRSVTGYYLGKPSLNF